MNLDVEKLNYSPVFVLRAPGDEPWKRVWGAVRRGEDWIWPAFYPFGKWVVSDLKVVAPWVRPTAAASRQLERLARDHQNTVAAVAAYTSKQEVPLDLPAGFKFHREPFAHQRLGIALGVANYRLFYLWEMRTGKTKTLLEVLRILKQRGEFRRALVLGPPIVRAVWETEAEANAPGELTTYAWELGDPQRAEKATKADIVTVSYAGARIESSTTNKLRAVAEELHRRKAPKEEVIAALAAAKNPLLGLDYDVVIGDESHQFGNWESQQTQAVLELGAKAARKYALSGTAGDQPGKFYPQLRFLSTGLMPLNYTDFKSRFYVYSKHQVGVVVGFKHLDEINAKVDKVATRMKQAECFDLPERVFTDLYFDLGPAQKTRYNELVRDMRITELPAVLEAYVNPDVDLTAPEDYEAEESPTAAILLRVPHGAARVTKLLQITSGFAIRGKDYGVCNGCPNMVRCVDERVRPYTPGCYVVKVPPPIELLRDFENPKLELLQQLLDNLLTEDPTAKVVVWGTFTQELDDIAEVCTRLKVKYLRISDTSPSSIRRLQEDFREDKEVRVLMGMVSSGIGIDLTPANHMVFYALPWDRIQYRQALERNSGPKQKRAVTVYRLLARDTIATYVAAALNFKDYVAYTLTEKIVCATCTDSARCEKEKNMPFRTGCLYSTEMARPKVAVEEV